MFRFVHAADIHLDSPLRGIESYRDAPAEQIRMAARRAFDNLVELAIDEEVAFVLIAGDLYDGDWKDYNTGIYFVNRMGRLRDAGIPVFLVSGNHDAASQITRALHLPDNVTLHSHRRCETRILSQHGVAIHGQSFSSKAVTDDLTRNYPQGDPALFNIGLLHTSLNGRPGHEAYAPCSLDSLRSKGYQYWALGHVHQREEICRDPWVVFPGNIQGRHIRETGRKGCTLVTVEEGRVTQVEARDLDVLRWTLCRVEANRCDRPEFLLEQIRERFEEERERAGGRPLALRLTLEGATPLHRQLHQDGSHWQEEFRALAAGLGDVWIEKILLRTRKELKAEEDWEEDSPLASLWKSVQSCHFESSRLVDIVPEFERLRSKLPTELLSDGDPFSPGKEDLETLREDVRELLMARMHAGGSRAN
ncbi:MAG: DNA repair exonuclease [Desulfuromonadaceae bacterium]|nr:DNA repair exonuclease [Desulfuromonadaceae bacterium]